MTCLSAKFMFMKINAFAFLLVVFISANSAVAHVSLPSDTVFNQTDSRNLKQGFWKKHYKNGKVAYQGFFKDDKPRGEFLRYHENGRLSARMTFSTCGDTAQTTLFSTDGIELAQGVYLRTKKHGQWLYYGQNKRVVYTESFNQGMKHGTFITYYPNGQVYEEVVWSNDEKHGVARQFYPDGTAKSNLLYKHGLEDGPIQTFYTNGQIRLKGQYVQGLKEGIWQIFSPENKVINRIEYQKGIASNWDELAEKETKELEDLLKNIGKIQDPTIEDFYRAGAY